MHCWVHVRPRGKGCCGCGLSPSHKMSTRSAKIPTMKARIRSGTLWCKMMLSSVSTMLSSASTPPSTRNNEFSATPDLLDGG